MLDKDNNYPIMHIMPTIIEIKPGFPEVQITTPAEKSPLPVILRVGDGQPFVFLFNELTPEEAITHVTDTRRGIGLEMMIGPSVDMAGGNPKIHPGDWRGMYGRLISVDTVNS